MPLAAPPASAAATAPARAPEAIALPVRAPADPQRPAAPASPRAASGADYVSMPVRVQPEPTPRTDRESAPGAASIEVVPTEEGTFWYGVVQGLVAAEAITALVRELALQSQLVGRDERDWILRIERASLNQPVSRERLQAALKAAGHDVQLAVEIGPVTDSPARRNAAAQAARQRAAEAIILGDPFVQQMMRDWGGKIVPGSIKPVQTDNPSTQT